MKTEIQEKLEKLAFDRTIPFCYGCFVKAPKGVCPHCQSDDLMRHLEGIGCEWGTDWVIHHILKEELTAVDTEEAFEDSVRSCYPEETHIGWLKVDTASAIKELDPIFWRIAKSDWLDQEVEDGGLVTLDNGSTYYWLSDIKSLIEK